MLVIACIPVELSQTITSLAGAYTANFTLIIFQGIFVYTLFYQVCILGPIDLAHVCMLRYNQKVMGILYCVIWGFSVAVQALVLEQLIDKFVMPHNTMQGETVKILVQDGMEMLCCLLAAAAMWPIHREERQEVRAMREAGDRSVNEAMAFNKRRNSSNYESILESDHVRT